MKKTLLFDMDGTLIESHVGILNSLKYMFEQLKLPVPPDLELMRFVGPPLEQSLEEGYQMRGQALENAVALFRSHYRQVGIYQNHLYEGIPTLLKNLKTLDYRLYVATSKPTLAATEIAKRLDIAPYFTEIVGSSPLHKTKADVIGAILAAENRADCLMIGDTKFDILGANAQKLDSIGVLYGYGNQAELQAAGATKIASKVTDLLNVIESDKG